MDPHSHSLPPEAPAWSLALGAAGRGAVWISFALFLLCAILAWRGREKPAALALKIGTAGLGAAFCTLLALLLKNRFEFEYVFRHGKLDYELQYKIAGLWGGQEGSVLLWSITSAIFLLISLRHLTDLRRSYLAVGGAIMTVLAAILSFESPFRTIPQFEGALRVPVDGAGMNPSLLNYWMVIHPPTIFSGFGALTPLFVLAMAGLITKNWDGWVRFARPMSLVAMTLLGVGLCMGGFWAYETLGWGGFWMWDPVENTSFVPWIACAAFVHGLFVQSAKGKWKIGNALMGGLPFVLFTYGTFMTRSGFLGDTTVHGFAEMDSKALWFLIGLLLASLISLLGMVVWRLRQGVESRPETMEVMPLNRAWFYSAGIWLLYAFGFITAIGMSWPLIQSLSGSKPQVVEEHLYHQVLGIFFPALAILLAVAPMVSWRGLPAKKIIAKILNPLAVSIFLVGVLLIWLRRGWQGYPVDSTQTIELIGGAIIPRVPWVLFLSFLCIFAAATNIFRLLEMAPKSKKSSLGGFVTHVGVMLALFGLIFSRGFEQKREVIITSNGTKEAVFGSNMIAEGPTKNLLDRNNKIKIKVTGPSLNFTAQPGLYYQIPDDGSEPKPMVWPSIHRFPLYDHYTMLYQLVTEASEPLQLEQGGQASYEGVIITYNSLRTEGTLGTVGAKFIADVTVNTMDGQSAKAEPMIEITETGMKKSGVNLGNGLKLSLTAMDAKTKAASFQFDYVDPAYLADVYYKPLTWLVWLGVGIMAVGGFMSAASRRIRQKASSSEPDLEPAESEDAPPSAS